MPCDLASLDFHPKKRLQVLVHSLALDQCCLFLNLESEVVYCLYLFAYEKYIFYFVTI